jgi:predicted kinase
MKPRSANKPHLLIPVGLRGSGKTYFAKHFAETFNAPFISVDEICQRLYGTTGVDKDQQSSANEVGLYLIDEVLKTGITVVFDGLSGTKAGRLQIRKKAYSYGYEPTLVWVQTNEITAKARSSKAITGEEKFEKPLQTEKAVVISGQHTFSSQLKIILKFLAGPATNQTPAATRELLINKR